MSSAENESHAAETAVEKFPGLSQVKAIVAIASAKGGTGKTTLTVNLAAALALKGRKIGIADADLDAPSAAAMLGVPRVRLISTQGTVEPVGGPYGIRVIANDPSAIEPAVSFAAIDPFDPAEPVLPSSAAPEFTSLEDLLMRTRFGSLDLLLIDLPPGFRYAQQLCRVASRAGVVIVSPASAGATAALRRALEQARRDRIRVVGLIENMQGFYCGNCHSVRPLLPTSDTGALARDFDIPILGRIPFDSRLAESCDSGRPFVREYPDAPVSKLINEAAQALMVAIGAPATRA